MRNSLVVIGLGETGFPLFNILRETYPDAYGYDLRRSIGVAPDETDVLHICLPYVGLEERFVEVCKTYTTKFNSSHVVVHTTVPVGVTSQIPNAVHSPILGRHSTMERDLRSYTKWIGGREELTQHVADHLERAHFNTRQVKTSEETEVLKLLCLAKYGVSLAFANLQFAICDRYGVSQDHIIDWDINYNQSVLPSLQRPIITPTHGKIGGHCVIPGTRILNDQFPNPLLAEVLKYA